MDQIHLKLVVQLNVQAHFLLGHYCKRICKHLRWFFQNQYFLFFQIFKSKLWMILDLNHLKLGVQLNVQAHFLLGHYCKRICKHLRWFFQNQYFLFFLLFKSKLWMILGLNHLEQGVQMSVRFHFLLEHCYTRICIHLRSFLLDLHSFIRSKLCGLWDQIHLEDLVPYFFLLEGAQQYLQRIHELPHQLLFHRCWVISYLIFSQKELYEILGQIHLEDLEPYFFLLEVVRQYLLRIHELPHQLLFLRCWVISYLIFSQKELYEILDRIHLEDLGPYFFLLEVVRQYLRRIHELPRQLLFLQCWVISYLIFSQKELYEILDRIHLEDLGPYFFLLEVVRQC